MDCNDRKTKDSTVSYSFEYETEIDLGRGDEEIQVEVKLEVNFDKNYGADADGNRGIPAYFCELLDLEAWKAYGIQIFDKDSLDKIGSDYEKNHAQKYEQEAIKMYEER